MREDEESSLFAFRGQFVANRFDLAKNFVANFDSWPIFRVLTDSQIRIELLSRRINDRDEDAHIAMSFDNFGAASIP